MAIVRKPAPGQTQTGRTKSKKPATANAPKKGKAKGATKSTLAEGIKKLAEHKDQPLQPANVQQDEGVMMARLTRYEEGVVTEENAVERRIPTPKFEGEVARTRVSMGVTKSLGGYEFARLDIMVELPCQPNPQDLEETNLYAARKVDEFMQRELDAILLPALPTVPAESRTNTSALIHGDN